MTPSEIHIFLTEIGFSELSYEVTTLRDNNVSIMYYSFLNMFFTENYNTYTNKKYQLPKDCTKSDIFKVLSDCGTTIFKQYIRDTKFRKVL